MKFPYKIKQRTSLFIAILLLTVVLVQDALHDLQEGKWLYLILGLVVAVSIQLKYWRNWRHAKFPGE